jgi:heme exporter protein B
VNQLAPPPLRQCVELARNELRLESRDRELLLVTAPFGAVALLIVPMAVGTNTPLLRQLGPGMYWVVVLLFGVLVTIRTRGTGHGLEPSLPRLCGVTAEVRLAGRVLAGAVLLLVFQLLLAPVAVLLYDPELRGWPALLLLWPLVAAGLAVLGGLAGALARGLDGRATLGPLLVVPLAVPMLLGATQVLEAARDGRAWWPWLLVVLTADLTAAVLAGWCARYLEELV